MVPPLAPPAAYLPPSYVAEVTVPVREKPAGALLAPKVSANDDTVVTRPAPATAAGAAPATPRVAPVAVASLPPPPRHADDDDDAPLLRAPLLSAPALVAPDLSAPDPDSGVLEPRALALRAPAPGIPAPSALAPPRGVAPSVLAPPIMAAPVMAATLLGAPIAAARGTKAPLLAPPAPGPPILAPPVGASPLVWAPIVAPRVAAPPLAAAPAVAPHLAATPAGAVAVGAVAVGAGAVGAVAVGAVAAKGAARGPAPQPALRLQVVSLPRQWAAAVVDALGAFALVAAATRGALLATGIKASPQSIVDVVHLEPMRLLPLVVVIPVALLLWHLLPVWLQGSPGQRLLGLKLVETGGRKPTQLRLVLRAGISCLTTLFFFAGPSWALFVDPLRRGPGDVVAGTVAVRR